MLAGEAGIPFKAFAEAVRPAEALAVAAVGALCFYEGEEDQVAHLCERRGGGVRGAASLRDVASLRSRGQLRAGQIGLPASRGRRRGAATGPLPPFALDQRLSKFASVLLDASAILFHFDFADFERI